MKTPRDYFAAAVIVLATIVAGSAAILSSFFDRSGKAADACTRLFAGAVAWAAGMRIQAEGIEHVNPKRSYVVVANHNSHLDAVALILTCPVAMRMLAKQFLFRIPLFGYALRRVGHIEVKRQHGRTDMQMVKEQTLRQVTLGRSLCVFAEGKRQPEGTLAPFKRGAFIVAKECNLPILPVSIVGAGDILPAKSLHFSPGIAKLRYHEPIMPTESEETLREQTFVVIEKSLGRTTAD